jgi:hypothetical protein
LLIPKHADVSLTVAQVGLFGPESGSCFLALFIAVKGVYSEITATISTMVVCGEDACPVAALLRIGRWMIYFIYRKGSGFTLSNPKLYI